MMTTTEQKQQGQENGPETSEQQPDEKKVTEAAEITPEQEAEELKSAEAAAEEQEPEAETPEEEQQGKNTALENQLAELNDRLLRKVAEFDNFRKRTAREQVNLLESASGHLMNQVLPVLDDMEQLEKLSPEQATADALLKGLTLLHQKLGGILQKEGLEQIPAEGEPFDPELHEVIAVMEDNEKEPGIILVEQQKGYKLRGHILRHSRVVINKEA